MTDSDEKAHDDPKSYLDVALEAERWIDGARKDDETGIAWSIDPDEPERIERSLYLGAAGIVLFYLELFVATGDERHVQRARAGADDLAAFARNAEGLVCGLYDGWSGLAFVLGEAARVTGDARYAEAARFCLDRLRAQASEIGAGLAWIEPMPYSEVHGMTDEREVYDVFVGAAGAGLALLHASEHELHPDALDWATAVGDRLLEVGETTAGGLRWQMMSDMPFPWTMSNFSHGAAGVGFFLGRLHEVTREDRFLAGAVAGARHVEHLASPVGDGQLVHHHDEDDGAELYYLSACHGPAGTSRLFTVLHRATGEAHWLDCVRAQTRGLLSMGAPEKRSDGFWNNAGQCCGDAGVGDFALALHHATGEASYLDLAGRVAVELVRRSETRGDGRCWTHAEHRMQPDLLAAQTGYMQGAAGIGSFFLHLHTTLAGRPVKIVFPDVP